MTMDDSETSRSLKQLLITSVDGYSGITSGFDVMSDEIKQ